MLISHEIGQCCTIIPALDEEGVRKSLIGGDVKVTGLFNTLPNLFKSFNRRSIQDYRDG